jgi:hypothetical protein
MTTSDPTAFPAPDRPAFADAVDEAFAGERG